MFTLRARRLVQQDPPLNERQRTLVEKKFEILRGASFGFTQDRLVHIQEDDLRHWTDQCVVELRRKIAAAAPWDIEIALLDFRALRCVSLQCRPLPSPPDGPVSGQPPQYRWQATSWPS